MSHDLKKWIRLQGEKHNRMLSSFFYSSLFYRVFLLQILDHFVGLNYNYLLPWFLGHHKFWPYLCLFTTFPTVINQHILWKKSDRKYWTLVNAFVFSLGSLPCKIVVFLILLYYLSKSWFYFFLQILYLFLKGQVGLIQANLS